MPTDQDFKFCEKHKTFHFPIWGNVTDTWEEGCPGNELPSTASGCVLMWSLVYPNVKISFAFTKDGYVLAHAPDGTYFFVWDYDEEGKNRNLVLDQVL